MAYAARFSTLVSMLEASCRQHADAPLFGTRMPRSWHWLSYEEFSTLVRRCRAGMAELGVQRGDRVAVISRNRLEWAIAAHATYSLGATFVPMYENQAESEWAYILRDSGASLCFVANAAIAKRIQAVRADAHSPLQLVCFDDEPGVVTLSSLLERGARAQAPSRDVAPEEIACLIYTSGTTGKPKGVKLTHGNLAANVSAILDTSALSDREVTLSFLPWAHVYGGCLELHTAIASGSAVAICDDPAKLLDYMQEVRPTLLFAVPRIWNRIYETVTAQIAASPPAIRSTFQTGMRARAKRRRGEALTFAERGALLFVERVVLPKIVAKLGGRLRFAFSGAAALSLEVAELIDNLGIEVFEGYGMTEGSGVITTNTAEERRLGSVGKPVPGVSVTLQPTGSSSDGEGEIIVYGSGVMAGYHGLEAATAEVLTPDGGLRTGDLGRFDADGFLYITGRVKELFKLSNGRYVAPAALEERLQLSPYIAQAFLYGDNQLHPVALLVVDLQALSSWATSRGLPSDLEQLLHQPATQELYAQELEKHSRTFKAFERLRSFMLEHEPFTVDNGLLTPTLKVRRRRVVELYERRLLALYGRESLPDRGVSSEGHASPLLS